MKTILIALVLMCIVFLTQAQQNYIIINHGENVVIYDHNTTSNGTVYMSVYPLTNPSVDMLKAIGIPPYLWGQVGSSTDGVYDTRLVECQQQLEAANAQLQDDTSYIRELEEDLKLWHMLCGFLLIAVFVLACVLAFKK